LFGQRITSQTIGTRAGTNTQALELAGATYLLLWAPAQEVNNREHRRDSICNSGDLGRTPEVRTLHLWLRTSLGVDSIVAAALLWLYKSQIPVIEQAIETAALMLGSDKSRGYCMEMICADFLAGANLDNGNSQLLLQSALRFFKFLPHCERKIFLHAAAESAA